MKMEQAQVGIVGLGLAAYSHLEGYRTHSAAQVVTVCDMYGTRADRFAQENNLPKVYTSYEEMLQDPEIKTIDIATPTFLHSSMAKQVAELGKHVHCEKPFCRYTGEGLDAFLSAERNGVTIMVGETYVFLSYHMKARELVEACEIGRPLQIRQWHGAFLERKNFEAKNVPIGRNWRLDPVKSGGGSFPWIFDHAVHFFSTAEYFMLDVSIREVFSLDCGKYRPA